MSEIRLGIPGTYPDSDYVATLDVAKDDPDPQPPEFYRRWIVGTVSQRGPAWQMFLSWLTGETQQMDGQEYYRINGLHIDYDHYGNWAFATAEGNTVRIILLEHFTGTTNEYRAHVASRNQKMRNQIYDLLTKHPTGNDLRALCGQDRRSAPHLDNPLPPDAVAEYRRLVQETIAKRPDQYQNVIV